MFKKHLYSANLTVSFINHIGCSTTQSNIRTCFAFLLRSEKNEKSMPERKRDCRMKNICPHPKPCSMGCNCNRHFEVALSPFSPPLSLATNAEWGYTSEYASLAPFHLRCALPPTIFGLYDAEGGRGRKEGRRERCLKGRDFLDQ